jgi:hypothetical protein
MSAAWRQLAFSTAEFGAELWALCRQVPLLDQVLCELDALHSPRRAEDRALRNHHRDLARTGQFSLKLPDSGAALHSGPSVMLEDKATVFGVQGRRDLLLASSRVGFGQPLSAVVLPAQRTVVAVRGARWNLDAAGGARAMALFDAAGLDWASPAPGAPVVVLGDRNYAHHAWNQLGALAEILRHTGAARVLATHQPLGPVQDLFADFPGLHVTPLPASALPGLDPNHVLPFAPGGVVVLPQVAARVRALAELRASAAVRGFVARAAQAGRRPVWLTVRVREKTAGNLAEALAALCVFLLNSGQFAVVLDGFAVPEDFAANRDYDNAVAHRMIAREQSFAHALCGMVQAQAGEAAMAFVHQAVGGGLLDSIFLAGRSAAYFAHHGTLQHRIGYFTSTPGLVHASPGILRWDRAATLRDVAPGGGAAEYVSPGLVADIVPPGGQDGHPDNLYRFADIPALVAAFAACLARWGATRA